MTSRRITALRIGIVVLLLAAGAAVVLSPLGDKLRNPQQLVATMRASRDTAWLPLAYVAAYSLLNVFFIPTQALSIAAVLVWGWAKGGAIELAAATIGALFPYAIARATGAGFVRRRVERHARAAELLREEGFSLLLLLRVVPLIPYTLLNYVAGFAAVRPLPYLAATLLGVIPSTFIFAYFVDAVVQGVMRPRDVALRIVAAGLAMAALVIGTRLATKSIRARLSE